MRVRLTEGQLERIKSITEGNDNRYNSEVKVSFYYPNVTYKGNEINDIVGDTMRLSYDIEIDGRSWGIKSISLYAISGPTDYRAEVEHYVSDFDSEIEVVSLQLDWSKLEINKQDGDGMVTIGDTLEITLANDSNGNIVVASMSLDVYTP